MLDAVVIQNKSKVSETGQKKKATAICGMLVHRKRCHKLTFPVYGNTLAPITVSLR